MALDRMADRDKEAAKRAAAAAADPLGDRNKRVSPARADPPPAATTTTPAQPLPSLHSQLGDTAAFPKPAGRLGDSPPGTSTAGRQTNGVNDNAPGTLAMPTVTAAPTAPSGPSTPSAAQFLASGMGGAGAQSSSANRANAPILEFNHAIAFVNKIKQRFSDDQDTYKQFLEILQTYQRDTKDIAEVSLQTARQ